MGNSLLAEILKLPAEERIVLVEQVWNSIANVPEAVKMSTALEAELEVALVQADADPDGGFSWEQVKQAVRDGSWRSD